MSIGKITWNGKRKIISTKTRNNEKIYLLEYADDECYQIVSEDTYIHAELRKSMFNQETAKEIFEKI